MSSPSRPLGILLLSGTHDRAHYAFMLASGAAALGRTVTLFAGNDGCRALLSDWSQLGEVGRDAVVRARGVSGLGELREHTLALGVRLLACETALKIEAIAREALLPEVEVAGLATFLSAVGEGSVVSV